MSFIVLFTIRKVIFWIGILLFFWFLHYKWRENYGKRYDSIERMALYPFQWRDYLQQKDRYRLNILNQLKGLKRDNDILIEYWRNWFNRMGVPPQNQKFLIKEASHKRTLGMVKNFVYKE
jgi:hypothetical protein